MKHLFLQGASKQGKSYSIRKCLTELAKSHPDLRIGGFSSRRLLDRSGNIVGYAIGSPDDNTLEVSCELNDPGIFSLMGTSGVTFFPKAFEEYGVSLLESALSQECDLILLDEIGGSELLVEPFKTALYEVLSGPLPCIGVLKKNSGARFMEDVGKFPAGIVRANSELTVDLVSRFDADILSTDELSQTDVECRIMDCLHSLLYTS